MKRKVTVKGKRVEIIYTDEKGKIFAHEDISLETYKKNYPKEKD